MDSFEDRQKNAPGHSTPCAPPAFHHDHIFANLRPAALPKERMRDTPPRYAALDLGTNNCRMLIAEARGPAFRVVDGFSRPVRLGERLNDEGRLSDAAMDRAVEALHVCATKLSRAGVVRARTVATEACRAAGNSVEFTQRVAAETGLELEVVDCATEARLAVAGCAPLIDEDAEGVLLFDIGGGSTEVVWIDLTSRYDLAGTALVRCIRAWASLPVGVVSLFERHGAQLDGREAFDTMVQMMMGMLDRIDQRGALSAAVARGGTYLLGTSGTATTLASMFLNLPRYDRRAVDGLWLANADVDDLVEAFIAMTPEERIASPCIGHDRAELMLSGCAILQAIRQRWPCERLRVADRGLREGILMELIESDRLAQRRRRVASRQPIHA